MFTFRSYQPGDEKEIVRLWNEALEYDPITPKRFRNLVLLDANFDPEGLRLAFNGEELIGVLYAIRRLLPMYGTDLEPDNGWIPFFFVKKEARGNGVAERLLKDAEQFFKAHNRKNIFFSSYAPNYILPGIDEKLYGEGYQFLLKNGFNKLYSPIAMDRNLVNYSLPDDIKSLIAEREKEGYQFKLASDGDLYNVIHFANEVFNPDWGRAIREGVLQGLPLEQILVATYEDKVVGFCIFGGYEGVPDRFGPFGVDPNQQGKGLGKILLHLCLKQMRAESLHSAWFLWTGEKTSAGYLYKKTGFEITRQFHVMKKEIK